MSDLWSLFFFLLRKSPLVLVLLGGFIFAVVRWKRHRRASLLASLGIGIYVIEIFVLSIVNYVLPGLLEQMHISMSSRIFTVIHIVDDVVYAGVLILLLVAAFSERSPQTALDA